MEFLSGKKIFDQVENLICQTDKQLRIAVSYWGIEVMDKTGLLGRIQEKSDSVRVICDLLSPGCNPEPIKQLKDLGVDVRTLDKFHAKVWFCGSDVIVGSPNFSKNGLGYDEKSLLSNNVEAAVHVRNKSFAKLVEAWFEEQWNKSDEVTDKKISEARSRKNQRKRCGKRSEQ